QQRKRAPRLEHDDPQSGTHVAQLHQTRSMIAPMRRSLLFALALIAGCAGPQGPVGQAAGDCSQLAGCPLCPVCPAPPPVAPRVSPLETVDCRAIAGWKAGEQGAAWPALLASCQALRWREAWRGACAKAAELRNPTDDEARRFLEENFVP